MSGDYPDHFVRPEFFGDAQGGTKQIYLCRSDVHVHFCTSTSEIVQTTYGSNLLKASILQVHSQSDCAEYKGSSADPQERSEDIEEKSQAEGDCTLPQVGSACSGSHGKCCRHETSKHGVTAEVAVVCKQ